MRRFVKIGVLFIFLFTAGITNAQSSFTLKYFGLTIHPGGDPMAHLQPNKLDPDAHLVLNSGVFIGYERFFSDYFAVKGIQGFLLDCSNGRTSVTHLGVRANLLDLEKHALYLGIGPTLIVRESWSRFGTEYVSSGFFNEYESKRFGELQYKMVPYGFEFEYDYKINPTNQLSVSFTPGLPIAGLVSIGWKHWFSERIYNDVELYDPEKKNKFFKRNKT